MTDFDSTHPRDSRSKQFVEKRHSQAEVSLPPVGQERIPASQIEPGDTLLFENFTAGEWVTTRATVARAERLVRLQNFHPYVVVDLDGVASPMEFANDSPVLVERLGQPVEA